MKALLYCLCICAAYCCKIVVDDTIEYDLTSMTAPYGTNWVDKRTGTSYEATLCNSAQLLPKNCIVDDAVATDGNGCTAFGRYSSPILVDYLYSDRPTEGLLVSYGGGSKY